MPQKPDPLQPKPGESQQGDTLSNPQPQKTPQTYILYFLIPFYLPFVIRIIKQLI